MIIFLANLQQRNNELRVFEVNKGLIIVLCRFHTIVWGRDILGEGGGRTTYFLKLFTIRFASGII